MIQFHRILRNTLCALALGLVAVTGHTAEPLKIGYSDWPGWVAWEIAIEKDWFAEEGVDVEFEWFDYVASMDAFAAGKLDAVGMTNGDTLVVGASGAQSIMFMVTDYSNGNDMIIASQGIESVKDLKGKKIGVEVGFVSHLLLLEALEREGLSEADVELVNVPTNETPQVLASGDVDAIVAWQPSSGQALSQVPGSTAIATSRDAPGLIYDVLAVSPASLATRKADWEKVATVWYKAVDYIYGEETQADALSIMAARVGIPADQYKAILDGTKILSLEESQAVMQKGEGMKSLYGSSKISDDFNVKYEVYAEPQAIDTYIDPSIILGM